jgi:hypothetical protein
MRPQQQNRRMRGRNNGGNNNNNNNNNRKGPNPLTRSYESNGPDVKIRGSAQQIAEKYTTLARDAMSSGDRVVAENYLQHAEHYNRIIAAAQAQFAQQNAQQQSRDETDEDLDDDGFEGSGGNDFQPYQQPQRQPAPQQANPQVQGSGPQPEIEGVPAEVALTGEGAGQDERRRDRRADRGEGANGHRPQPSSTAPAEGAEEQGEPAQAAASDDQQGGPRRPRRPRRPRNRDANGEANADAAQGQPSEDVAVPAQ